MTATSPPLPPALSGERFVLVSDGSPVAAFVAEPEDGGSSDDGGGPPPLLLVHSINAAASAYEIKPLFDHYRRTRAVYALDLPGYGLSDRSDRFYSPRMMTNAVLVLTDEIARRHGPRPIDAIAVSLSSEYLARAAHEHPARFRGVCLVSATGLNRAKPFDGAPGTTRGKRWLLSLLGRAPWSEALFRGLTRPRVIRFFLQKTWGSNSIDEGLQAYDVLTTRQPGASRAPFHFLSQFLFSADISRIYTTLRLPVLLVHGTRGDFVRYPDADRLVRDAGWKRHVMQTGAMPYFEDLAGFAAAHDAFVRDHSPVREPNHLGRAPSTS